MSEQRLVVGSAKIHVETTGEGLPVVLLHGLGLSGALWSRVRDGLGPDYELILVDLRGAGRTQELAREEIKHLLYLLIDVVVQFGVEHRQRCIQEIWYDPDRKHRTLAAAR